MTLRASKIAPGSSHLCQTACRHCSLQPGPGQHTSEVVCLCVWKWAAGILVGTCITHNISTCFRLNEGIQAVPAAPAPLLCSWSRARTLFEVGRDGQPRSCTYGIACPSRWLLLGGAGRTKMLMRCAMCLQFLQRARVLALYRTVLRGTRRISDQKTRDETRLFARQEIERHRHVQDLVCLPLPSSPPVQQLLLHRILADRPPSQQHIRYLLSTGKTQWDGLERFIDGM